MKINEIDALTHRTPDYPVEPLLVKRWSPYALSGEPITQEQLMTILDAVRWAPSSYNEQPWRVIYALRDTPQWQPLFDLLVEPNQAWAKHAAALFLFATKKTFTRGGKPNPVAVYDCGSAWQNFALQTTALGLYAHGMAGFNKNQAPAVLGIPDDFEVCAMAAVGKPGRVEDLPEEKRDGEKPTGRMAIEDYAFEGRFQG